MTHNERGFHCDIILVVSLLFEDTSDIVRVSELVHDLFLLGLFQLLFVSVRHFVDPLEKPDFLYDIFVLMDRFPVPPGVVAAVFCSKLLGAE